MAVLLDIITHNLQNHPERLKAPSPFLQTRVIGHGKVAYIDQELILKPSPSSLQLLYDFVNMH